MMLHEAPEIFKKLGRTIKQWFAIDPMVDTTQDKKNRTVKGLHLLQCVIYGKI